MMKYVRILAIALFFLPLSSVAQKQFEGELTISISNKKEKEKPSTIKALITPSRIRIDGGDKKVDVEMFGAEDISVFLIRLDSEDFVIYSNDGDNTALRISKMDIENMMNMVKNMKRSFGNQNEDENDDDFGSDVSIKETTETKTIAGYKAKKLIIKSADSPNDQTFVWVTDELNIHLGMLTSDWEFLGSLSSGSNKWLKKGQFPLLVEQYEGKTLESVIEVTEVKSKKINGELLEVPANMQLMSFQDLLMKKMMGQ